MKKQFSVFLIRWLLNSIGIWVSVRLLSDYQANDSTALTFLLAGLIFSVANSVLKPIVIILSLPAILVTLGLFTFVVNGLMVYLSLAITPGLSMTFGASIIAGIILSLVNYIVSSALELKTIQE